MMSRTLVQRPTPIESTPNALPAIPPRPRRAPTVEVIDVDDLYEEISRSNQSGREGLNHRLHPTTAQDVIDVDELDDDVQLLGEASQIGNTNASNNGFGAGGEW